MENFFDECEEAEMKKNKRTGADGELLGNENDRSEAKVRPKVLGKS